VAIAAAAIVAGFAPHGALSGAESTATRMVQIAESPVTTPVLCLDATCGKGSPAPAAPSPAVALAGVLARIAAAAAAVSTIRRRRPQAVLLPAGARDPLFHPPRFS
jgi:hypothetical protein